MTPDNLKSKSQTISPMEQGAHVNQQPLRAANWRKKVPVFCKTECDLIETSSFRKAILDSPKFI